MAMVWDDYLQQYVDDGTTPPAAGGGYAPYDPTANTAVMPPGGWGNPNSSIPWAPGYTPADMEQDNIGVAPELQVGFNQPGGDTNPPGFTWDRYTGRWVPGAHDATDGGGGGYDMWGGVPNRPSYDDLPGFEFTAPTQADLYADPSYSSRLNEGRQALEQSASGRGTLRTGGTLKDILSYGQNFASREYGNVYDRRFQEAKAKYEPQVMAWQQKNRMNELEFNRLYDKAMAELDDNYRFTVLGATI